MWGANATVNLYDINNKIKLLVTVRADKIRYVINCANVVEMRKVLNDYSIHYDYGDGKNDLIELLDSLADYIEAR